MPRKHELDTANQGLLLPPPEAAITAGLYQLSESNVFFPGLSEASRTDAMADSLVGPVAVLAKGEAPVSDRTERLQSLLKTMDLLGQMNRSDGFERSTHIPSRKAQHTERYRGVVVVETIAEDGINLYASREMKAKKAFAHASGHDKRLERMPEDQARRVTHRAYNNLVTKYYPAGGSKTAKKARERLRHKVRRLAADN